MRHIVVWSGGMDSTVLLHYVARYAATVERPVVALTLDHPYLHRDQMRMQEIAQTEYLAWAKKKGLCIQHTVVKLVLRGEAEDQTWGQPPMWLSHLAPLFGDKDKIYFGYLKRDVFWHGVEEWDWAWKGLDKLYRRETTYVCDFEYKEKWEILQKLQEYRIPKRCWWTCEHPDGKKPCGRCHKCRELEHAKIELAWLKENDVKQLETALTKW